MTIAIANNALENCNGIDSIVELINDEFATDASPELVAAAYAIDGADVSMEDDYSNVPDVKEHIECHLDTLVENGAKFDYQLAVEVAVNEKKN